MTALVYGSISIILACITVFFIPVTAVHLLWILPLLILGYALIFIILHCLIFVLSAVFVNTKKAVKGNDRPYRKFVAATLDLIFFLVNINIHTTGLEKIPKDSRFLFVSNHTFDFDPAVFLHTLKEYDLAFIGKKEIYSSLTFIAKIMHRLNGLPIDRENNRKAVETINKAADLIKNNTASVAIFPEGYVSKTGELLPFRNGAFKIAKKAKCPVVVATVSNTKIILKNLFRRRTDIYLNILDVIPTQQVETLTTAQISEKVYSLMAEDFEKNKTKNP